jgi:lipopolysaccharide export system protein LptA
LSGGARFSNGEDAITASTVVLDQRTGDAVARGKVVAAIGGDGSSSESAGAAAAAQPVTHIMASEARLTRAGKLAEFRGTDTAPARMWQGGSQVQAAVLFFDGVKRSMSARPLAVGAVIHAVFAGQGKAAEPVSRTQGAAAKVMRVSAQRMDYADLPREATFSGQVKMEGEDGTVESDRAVVMLTPARAARGAAQPATVTPLAGSVEKAVAYGNVRLQQPGRRGTGDQLTYTAADAKFVLTGTAGHPPHVVDDQQGDVTGAVLIFVAPARGQDKGDSTIIVAGEPPGSKARGGRVHTETDVRR